VTRRRLWQLHAVVEDGDALLRRAPAGVARHGDQVRVAGRDGDVVGPLRAAEVRVRAQRDVRPEGLRGDVEAADGAGAARRVDAVVAEVENLTIVRERELIWLRPGAGGPSAPVSGLISVTELPPAPAREGTLAKSCFDCLS
jgi:hypothetical protein